MSGLCLVLVPAQVLRVVVNLAGVQGGVGGGRLSQGPNDVAHGADNVQPFLLLDIISVIPFNYRRCRTRKCRCSYHRNYQCNCHCDRTHESCCLATTASR